MFVVIYFAVLILTCSWLLVDSTARHTPHKQIPITRQMNNTWKHLSKTAHDPARPKQLTQLLTSASGIYLNKQLNRSPTILNTIIVTVVAYESNTISSKYKEFLMNYFCYAENYGYMPVVYYLDGRSPNSTKNLEVEKELKQMYENLTAVSYPYELFWKLVSQKNIDIQTKPGSASFSGDIPSFEKFGAMVMLVPILEILELGFNVAYFDVDVAFVHDPIPFMLRGDADVIVSPELRYCMYPSRQNTTKAWSSIEPNTGVMFVRSNVAGAIFFRTWLQAIVDNNVMNDQKVLTFAKYQQVHSCNVDSVGSSITNNPRHSPKQLDSFALMHNPPINTPTLTYCILNEFLFQNGKVALHCPQRDTAGDYFIGIQQMGVHSKHVNLSSSFVRGREQQAGGETVALVAPAVVHVNYCGVKQRCLSDRGLWLYNQSITPDLSSSLSLVKQQCSRYDILNTQYGSTDWRSSLAAANLQYSEEIQQFPHGSLVRYPKEPELYIIDNGTLRLFNDFAAFTSYGFDTSDVRPMVSVILRSVPRGRDMTKGENITAYIPPRSTAPTAAPTAYIININSSSNSSVSNNDAPAVKPDPHAAAILANSRNWQTLAQASHQREAGSQRNTTVLAALQAVAGIYHGQFTPNIVKYKLQKTVLVNVVSIGSDRSAGRYMKMLRNWQCFADSHGLRYVLYVVPSATRTFAEDVEDLRSNGITALTLPYPESLFWTFLSEKKTKINNKGGFLSDYAGSLVSFQHYGALVMILPLYEIVSLGYNIIYLDLDIGFVHDPIPYMIQGDSDISVSLEQRTCIFPSAAEHSEGADWYGLEPNTGIMHMRSNAASIQLFREWIARLIKENMANDQKALNFGEMKVRISFGCNSEVYQQFKTSKKLQSVSYEKRSAASFCYLNEFLFQNGKMCLACAHGRGGSLSEYVLGMADNGHKTSLHSNNTFSSTSFSSSSSSATSASSSITNKLQLNDSVIAPLLVHMNYCDDKIQELHKLGLWLAKDMVAHNDSSHAVSSNHTQSHTPFHRQHLRHGAASSVAGHISKPAHDSWCHAYQFDKTLWVTKHVAWSEKVDSAKQELEQAKLMFRNGSVVKLYRQKHISLVDGGQLRTFPNAETYVKMGYNWSQVHYAKQYSFTKLFPIGEELPDLA